MNILFSTTYFAPHVGGAESMVDDLTRQLARQGHRVTVLTSLSSGNLPPSENREGVHVVRWRYPRSTITGALSALRLLIGIVAMWLRIGRLLERERFEVVCVGIVGIGVFPLLLWHRLRRFRLVIYLHGGELRSYVRVSPAMRWALARALRTCDAAIAVSERLKEEAIGFEPLVGRKITVIANAIDTRTLSLAPAAERARPYIFFAGRLHPVKGLDRLLAAFSRVADRLPTVDLLIAGEGPLRDELLQQVNTLGLTERIHLLGPLPRSEVISLLKGCEFAVLPSLAEGCPMIALEAQAAGKLIVGSRVKGIVEVVTQGVNGDLFDPDDPDALAALLVEHVRDPARRRAIEAHLREATPATIGATCEEHLRVYRGETARLAICVVSTFFAHDGANSGLSSFYDTLCRSLLDLGHSVHLLTSPESRPETQNGMRVTALRTTQKRLVPDDDDFRQMTGSIKRAAARVQFAWEAWRVVRKIERSSEADVIIAPELFAPGLFISLMMPRKLVTRLHTPTVFGNRYNNTPRRWIASLAAWPERLQAFRSSGMSAASAHLIDAVSKEWRLPMTRIALIPNGVRIDALRNVAAAQGREVDGDYLLYFGRLERRKGVHLLTDALQDVLAHDPTVKAVYVGRDWGLKASILKSPAYASGRLALLDTMDRPRLLGIIRHAKLVILPSLFENVSNAALETMALSRPLIGTRGTAFEELIEDGVNGFLTEPGDSQSLAATINRCLQRIDLDAVGERALESIRQYDGLTVARQHVAFMRKTLSG